MIRFVRSSRRIFASPSIWSSSARVAQPSRCTSPTRFRTFSIATGDRILLLVTEGGDPSNNPGEVVPARLISAGLHRHPFYDLRGMRKAASRTDAKVRDWEEELVRLADDLHGSKEGTGVSGLGPPPRSHSTMVWEFAASAAAVLIVLAGAGWQWTRTNTFQLNHLLSEMLLKR